MLDDLRELYQEVILDHGKNPRNYGKPDEVSHRADGHNPLCGDRISVYLDVDAEGVVRNAAFDGRGCAISQASASLMTEIVSGKTLGQVDARCSGISTRCVRPMATWRRTGASPTRWIAFRCCPECASTRSG